MKTAAHEVDVAVIKSGQDGFPHEVYNLGCRARQAGGLRRRADEEDATSGDRHRLGLRLARVYRPDIAIGKYPIGVARTGGGGRNSGGRNSYHDDADAEKGFGSHSRCCGPWARATRGSLFLEQIVPGLASLTLCVRLTVLTALAA